MDQKYLSNRSWRTKVSSMPRIPRGAKGYISSLKIILEAVREGRRYDEVVDIPGSNSKRTLGQECKDLRGAGFVKPTQGFGSWILTDISKEWLTNKDDSYLAYYINGQIKYFSELLYFCKEPRTSANILEDAVENYKMLWKKSSQIFERTSWLRDLGYLEYIDFNSTFKTTEKGLEFLEFAKPFDYEEIKSSKDLNYEFSINLDNINNKILNLVPKTNLEFESRIHSMGYTPGSTTEVLEVITGYLELAVEGHIALNDIVNYSKETYGIRTSSIRRFISVMVKMGLLERISMEDYEVTNQGKIILQDDNIYELMIFYHAKYLYFFEILSELKNSPMTVNDINNVGNISYGVSSKGDIGKRISLLKAAHLIYQNRKEYHLTKAGEEILNIVNVQSPKMIEKKDEKNDGSSNDIKDLMMELVDASRDSSNPDRFEKAIYNAFVYLGFQTRWIGKSGNTDVFVQNSEIPKLTYKVNIDAKSTYSGPVKEGQVDFDTLQEHKERMSANYVVVVGKEFVDGRLVDRAKEHEVGLLSVDKLNDILREHAKVPITSKAYRKFFEQSGIMETTVLNPERLSMLYQGNLIKTVMTSIYEHQQMTVNSLYWLIQGNQDYKVKPTENQIQIIVDFLSSPIIGCIEKNGSKYVPVGTIPDTINELKFLSRYLSSDSKDK